MRTLTVFKVKGKGFESKQAWIFSGFFVTAKVVYITAIIIFHLIILYLSVLPYFKWYSAELCYRSGKSQRLNIHGVPGKLVETTVHVAKK